MKGSANSVFIIFLTAVFEMKEFKYDVRLLIQAVRERTCLWNKSLEVYKDRVERRNAWEEIFNILDDRYELLPPEERRLTGEHILNKWTNIRDTFIKSLKSKMGRPKRKYMLHDHMKFLLVNEEHGEEPDFTEEINVPYLKEENESNQETALEVPVVAPRKRSKRIEHSDDSYVPKEESSSYSSKKRSRKKNTIPEESNSKPKDYDTSGNDIDFVEVDDSGEQRVMNEDEAFFASLLPTIVKYNEDERLQFRIEVLGVMKRIKDNRKWGAVEDQ